MSLTNSTPLEVAKAASTSSHLLASLPVEERNHALSIIYDSLSQEKDSILAANARDLQEASKAASNGTLKQSILKRLDLSRPGKWEDMLQGILDVRSLPDPSESDPIFDVGWRLEADMLYVVSESSTSMGMADSTILKTLLDDDLELHRESCPIGVLLVIFEARPEVIANIASLAIKSGNAAILKGGKESTESFTAISSVISKALDQSTVPKDAIQLVTTRDVIPQLLAQDRYIDLVIPRGSNELVRYVKSHTSIPVLGHADGLCSIYIHADADAAMCERILLDAKLAYPAACNAVETLLIDDAALSTILPSVAATLLARGVSLRCDAASKAALANHLPSMTAALVQDAAAEDYDTEFLDVILAVRTIPPTRTPEEAVDLAIAHVNAHSSKHTDVILTAPASRPLYRRFLKGVDSAGVFWNTSSRMADGMRFGFGTEVGISTNKIHARGPVGLEGLTIYKYGIAGNGQVPSDYHSGEGGRSWKHQQLPI